MDRPLTIARARAVAMLAAIVGMGASAYLLVEYVTGQSGICLTGSGCDLVRASAFAYPLGIPMPLFGVAFYGVAAYGAWRTLDPRPMGPVAPSVVMLGLAAAGLAVSAALTGVEAFVVHAFCSWCLVQAGAGLVLFVAALVLFLQGPQPDDGGHSARRRQQALRALEGERASLRRTGTLGGGVMGLAVGALLIAGALGSMTPVGPGGSNLAPGTAPRTGAGPVEVVEFADFQCPACASVAPVLADLASRGQITLVYRYFPLVTIHANAMASARAAAAAGLQGAFWSMDERLFASQGAWASLGSADADAFFASLAAAIGLNVDQWRADYASSAVAATLNADLSAAGALGLSGTPTLYIDGALYRGPLDSPGISAAVAQAAAT